MDVEYFDCKMDADDHVPDYSTFNYGEYKFKYLYIEYIHGEKFTQL